MLHISYNNEHIQRESVKNESKKYLKLCKWLYSRRNNPPEFVKFVVKLHNGRILPHIRSLADERRYSDGVPHLLRRRGGRLRRGVGNAGVRLRAHRFHPAAVLGNRGDDSGMHRHDPQVAGWSAPARPLFHRGGRNRRDSYRRADIPSGRSDSRGCHRGDSRRSGLQGTLTASRPPPPRTLDGSHRSAGSGHDGPCRHQPPGHPSPRIPPMTPRAADPSIAMNH